ncbi:SDR family NAD(P)-dependent oxidoreductase [Streptomyces sp. NPDC055692]|uniref:SDR family NAD(P)-dependent oxidoreductase n=1 Tax=Streptomyces sp. NPDC055692 TaxID=3155683 RepID=UPI00343A8FE4
MYLVTGGSSGIGYFISEQLATTGARIIITARNADKARLAIEAIHGRVPHARVDHLTLDLAKLDSVAKAADELGALPRLDGVVLNAGVLAQHQRSFTADGHELVFGTNHLGHFALVERLLPLLEAGPGSRIVTIGSLAARFTRLDLEDLQSSREPYRAMRTYARSKLAQTTFAIELDRRLRAVNSHIDSVIAHPGGALDGLTPSRPPLRTRRRTEHLRALPQLAIAQSKENAAWPAVRAVLDPGVSGGDVWGPRVLRSSGKPTRESTPAEWSNREVASELWERSEAWTGTTWAHLADSSSAEGGDAAASG